MILKKLCDELEFKLEIVPLIEDKMSKEDVKRLLKIMMLRLYKLDFAREIEQSWVRCCAPEILDLANIIKDNNLKNQIIENKENPYIKNIIENSLKSTCYAHKKLAEKYYFSKEILDRNFKELDNVELFIKENFSQLSNQKNNLLKQDLKLESDYDFKEGF
jgi:YesN/AraC family two-component response regulator